MKICVITDAKEKQYPHERILRNTEGAEYCDIILIDYEYMMEKKLDVSALMSSQNNDVYIVKNNRISSFVNKFKNTLYTDLYEIIIDDPLFMVSSEISRNINHYIFNIITAIILQIELIEAQNIPKEVKNSVNEMMKTMEKMIDSLETIGSMKYVYNESSTNSPLSTVIDKQIELIRDYVNTNSTKLTYKLEDFPVNSIKVNNIRIVFFTVIMFLFHCCQKSNGIINANISKTENGIQLFFTATSVKALFMTKKGLIDDSLNIDARAHIYWEILNRYIAKINGDYEIKESEQHINISIIIPHEGDI